MFTLICRCCENENGDPAGNGEARGGYSDDEDDSISWLKEMGVQDKIKKPDSISIQLYPPTVS